MKFNLINIVLIICFAYPIIKGFVFKFSSNNIKKDVEDIVYNISFLVSLFLSIYLVKKIFFQHDKGIYKSIYNMIPDEAIKFFGTNFLFLYIIMVPLLLIIIFKIITFIADMSLKAILYPVFDGMEGIINRSSNLIKRIFGGIFQIPRGICYVLLISFILNILSMFNVGKEYGSYLEKSSIYKSICQNVIIPLNNSKLAQQLPNIIDNSFKVEHKEIPGLSGSDLSSGRKVIVYYNGITLDEGVKSNAEIDNFAVKLAEKGSNKTKKAEILYNWVGSNISYDEEKANQVLNDNYGTKSGAIPTFYNRKGICFDYACLYVAMCRANGIKVRLITGQGFNGVSWVSHAWNQIYIPEESKWINVDTTFYKGGNYFNSIRFEVDHRGADIAGEW